MHYSTSTIGTEVPSVGASVTATGGADAPTLGTLTDMVSPHSNTGGNSGVVEGVLGHSDAVNGLHNFGEVLPQITGVGTDYFRLTCDDSRTASHLYLECKALAREYLTRGDRERPWRYMGGYDDGWSVGPISFAEGRNSILVQASGVASDPLFEMCKKGFVQIRPTRLDIQTTIDLGKDDPGYARRMARRVDRFRHSGKREGYPFKVHVRDGKGDGDTLEIGTRGSEVYLRLYDKHREGFKKTHSKQVQPGQYPPGSWRFEAELKGVAASELYCRLWDAPNHSGAVLNEVQGLFVDHGLKLPVDAVVAAPIREVRYQSDTERRRAWLRSAVRPAVQELVERGLLGEVLSDLGLSDAECVDLSRLLLVRPSLE